jgi:hypothetical protein
MFNFGVLILIVGIVLFSVGWRNFEMIYFQIGGPLAIIGLGMVVNGFNSFR